MKTKVLVSLLALFIFQAQASEICKRMPGRVWQALEDGDMIFFSQAGAMRCRGLRLDSSVGARLKDLQKEKEKLRILARFSLFLKKVDRPCFIEYEISFDHENLIIDLSYPDRLFPGLPPVERQLVIRFWYLTMQEIGALVHEIQKFFNGGAFKVSGDHHDSVQIEDWESLIKWYNQFAQNEKKLIAMLI